MTADIRTAAQREAVTKAYNIVTGQDERAAPDATLAALEELWAAARVTPTREALAD